MIDRDQPESGPHPDPEPETQSASGDILGDLAFMRQVVSDNGRMQVSGGAAFLAGGICYGIQCLIGWAELNGWLTLYPLGNLIANTLPTVVFLAFLTYVLWKDRKAGQHGVATRALNAAFGSAGLANISMVIVFGYNAIAAKDIYIWLFYPIVVCAFQGAVWYIAFMIRRRGWLGVVSIGWFITTIALGFLLHSPHYAVVLGVALIGLMGGSGFAMMRQGKRV